MKIGRRAVLTGAAALVSALVSGAVWAEAPARVPRPQRRPEPGEDRALRRMIEGAKLSGVLAYAVADGATGAVLAERDADMPLPPASVAKSVTALFALEKLGPKFRFRTRVMRVGAVVNGRLEGDLLLVGGGDPNLDTDQLGDLVAALAAAGIASVSGRFLAVEGALPYRAEIDRDQPDFLGYNPAISGLMLNYNRVNFEWKRAGSGWTLGMDARGERFLPPVRMARVEVVARELPLFAYRAGPGVDLWTVAGSALGDGGSRWLPVRQPGIYTAEVFQTLCAAHGLKLPDAEVVSALPEGAVEVVAHEGEDLPEVLRKMLKFSTNLTAEAVGLTASGAGTQEGSAAAMTGWARRRFGIGAAFGDHSGLGAKSRVTARDLMQVMLRAGQAKNGALLAGILRDHGLADANGKEIADSKVRVRAKSGTLNFVSNLAGHIGAPGGREVVFAVLAADVPRREAVPMNAREDPPGGAGWTKRARRLQQMLIRSWAEEYL